MAMTNPIDRARRALGNINTTVESITEPKKNFNWPDLRLERYSKHTTGGVCTGTAISAGFAWWHCYEAHPQMWFPQTFLDNGRKAYHDAQVQYQRALARGEITEDEPEWSFFGPWCVDGDRIKLRAANGTWVWILTGVTRPNPNPVGSPLVHQGVWPD